MSDALDVLRVPGSSVEPETKSELGKYTYRSWWCKKFHDRHMYTVGYTYVGKRCAPIRVCKICLLDKMF